MRRKSFAVVGLAAMLAVALASFAAKPGGTKSSLPACATFRDALADRIQGDGVMPSKYCHQSDGNVVIGTTEGRFRLDTSKLDKNNRTVFLDVSNCLDNCSSPLVTATANTEVVFQTRREYEDLGGTLVGGDHALNLLTIPQGQSRFCALFVDFAGPMGKRTLTFTNETDPITACSGGSPVTVTCLAAASDGTCRQWRIEGANACFWEAMDPSGATVVLRGVYSMLFQISNLELK